MQQPSSAATLFRISEQSQGERARRAAAGALVLRAVETWLEAQSANPWETTRAKREVAGLRNGSEPSHLHRILLALEGGCRRMVADSLVGYACHLESTRLPEADAALALARALAPESAEVCLDAGRVARRLGDCERALAAYQAARALDGAGGALARLAAIGEAAVSPQPAHQLGLAIRAALAVRDLEAAAVGFEERARIRRSTGERAGAIRDLCRAACHFTDPVDRARVAHAVADLALAEGDPSAAREALLAALAWGDAPQRDHAQNRLHTLSRDVGDQVGMRRWRSWERPSLVSLSVRPRPRVGATRASRLRRWREALAAADS